MEQAFTEQVALVTGAGSAHGIGFAVARRLHSAGAHVAITSTTGRIHERARESTLAMGKYWHLMRTLQVSLRCSVWLNPCYTGTAESMSW